jgi:hypothetical protein
MRGFISRLSLNESAVPVALLFVTVVSFGLLIPWLGFYWDDWPVIYLTQTQGTGGFRDFYQYDRPFSAWTYIVFAPLLGTSPLAWQIFALSLRWLTALLVWASLRQIWPDKPHQVFWTALLFAVAPLFPQQSVAVAYSQHWLCYLLFFASVYCMLRALNDPRRFYLFTALALLTSLLQLLTMEYFVGLELLRPVILWFYFLEKEPGLSVRRLFKRVIASGWAYVVLLIAYVIWRMFFLRLAGADPNNLDLLDKIRVSPSAGLLDLAQKAVQDLIYLVTSWLIAVKPADIELGRPFALAALAIAIAAGIASGMLVRRYKPVAGDQDSGADRWHIYAMILGLLAILLGTLPVWMIDRQVSLGPLGSRFSLAAIFGVSLLWVGFLEWLSPRKSVKITILSVLVAIAIHANLHIAKAYQQSWEKQRTFYWQLFWRAPHIRPGTALIADGEIFSYVGLYSTSMGISMLYPPGEVPQQMPYWFFSYWERLFKIPKELAAGTLMEEELRNYSFQGQSKEALLLDFSPERNRCLHLLSPHDEQDPDLPESMRGLLSISNLSRIEREPLDHWQPPASIFGSEPEHTWCYYFEKAELAHQYEDWQEVIRLMKEAQRLGFTPTEMKEYLPLLEAYLQTGQVEPARALSLQMARLSNNIDDRICTLWLDASESGPDPQFIPAFEDVRGKSGCFD